MTSGPTSPTLFEQCHGFFYVSFQLNYKDEGDKANGLMSLPIDAIIWTELAWSHHFFLRPWLMVRPGFELATFRSADRRFSNWANRAAVCFINFSLFIHAKYTLNYAFIILVGQWNNKKIENEDKGERNSRISAAGYPKRNPVSIT